MDEFWFVGVGGTGPFFQSRADNWVVPLWQELFRQEAGLPDEIDRGRYLSPCHARETEFTCYCGFAARGRPTRLPVGLKAFRVPKHEYAVGAVSGGPEAIGDLYRELPAWATARGRPVDNSKLWLEVYSQRPVLDPTGPFSYEVWLPID